MKVEANGNHIMREQKTNGIGYTDTASSGVSSNDTRRSSIRYEPVDTPPSPDLRHHRHDVMTSRHTDDDVTDEEERMEEVDDVTSMEGRSAEETRPLNPRRRMSSPVVIEYPPRDQYLRRDVTSVLARTNSGTVYSEARHSNRTRLHPQGGAAQSQANSLYKPKMNTIVTSRLPASQTTQFDPVVMTSMNPAHEADQSEWSYLGGSNVRSPFPFPGGVASPPLHPGAPTSGEDTAARFMKRPSLANAYNHTRCIGNPSYEKSGLKTLKSKFPCRCSWKCAALFFAILSFLLIAFLAYFLVQSFATNRAHVSCQVTSKPIEGAGTISVVDSQDTIDKFEMQTGRRSAVRAPPNSFWRSSIYIPNDANVKFNFTVDRRSSIGVYGRKGIQPTHTKFDFFEKIDGSSVPARSKRAIVDDVTVSFIRLLSGGKWFISVFNDGSDELEAIVSTNIILGLSVCPNNCNQHGDCIDGVCKCFAQYRGTDCGQASCPVVCSGRGLYAHGGCVCFSGWKGVDCSTPTDQCEVPDCSGRGSCEEGECVCDRGWTGLGCETVTCPDPSCSNRGVCVRGICHCDRGWKGRVCDAEDPGYFEKCSGHGLLSEGGCVCDAGWSGSDCSQESATSPSAACLPACHPQHGSCVLGKCECDQGWAGDTCSQRTCHERCQEHGLCSNGECVCKMGWNGDLCGFEGCPGECGIHGHCRKDPDNAWSCSCDVGWKGVDCNTQVELNCDDGRDNDRDTLRDCHDPDCCSAAACRASPHCRSPPDPADYVTKTGRIPATFHDRVRFLATSSFQNVNPDKFDPRLTSVVRGQVVTLDGSPLVGVKVQIQNKATFGFVRTRSDGWFDMLLIGGGSETLKFERSLLLTTQISVFVPLNDFVVMPIVVMRTGSQPEQTENTMTDDCDVSAFPRPQSAILPQIVDVFSAGDCKERGNIVPEIQAVRESIGLPFSEVDLVYMSSRTSGYKSKIEVQLTGSEVPGNLRQILVRISVQGTLHEKAFEPLPETKYSFIWDRLDAYKRPVYGDVTAKVEIGYKFESCAAVVWDLHLTKVRGQDPIMQQSIGGWSLSIHHRYHSGVVHLGNGGSMQLNRQPPMMSTVMGTGAQRHTNCEQCTGPASEAKLLAPVSLACDAKGNIFVGDYNYIRKIDTNGDVSSLLFLRNPPHKYYVAASPTSDGTLYYSDPNAKRIYKIRNMNPRPRSGRQSLSGTDVASNMEVVAGTGETCLPLMEGKCGDRGPALSAKLSGPRGLVVDRLGRVFFVDGTSIRVIGTDGVIDTFAGSHNMASSRPLPCDGTISLDQLQFDFPTDVTMNMLDDSLYVLDSNFVIRIDTRNEQASLAAGVPVECARKASKMYDDRDSRRAPLVSPTSIVSSPLDGSIYVAEADNQFVNRVQRIDPYGFRMSVVAGGKSGCDCQMSDCDCFQGDGDFGRNARLNTPAALAASPNGSVFVADQLNMRIRRLAYNVPDSASQIRIANPDSNEVYLFTNDGFHRTTQNVITGETVYNFTYNSDRSLSSITDVHGNRLSIVTDKDDMPAKLVLPNRKILKLQFDSERNLERISEGFSTDFASLSYQEVGLLQSATLGRSQSSFFFYDVDGRLVSAVSPTGGVTRLHASANATTRTVTMTKASTSVGNPEENQNGVGSRSVVIATQPGHLCDIVTTQEGEMRATYERWSDNSISVRFLDGSELVLETKPHPVLGLTAPYLAKRTVHLPSDPIENNIEWRRRKQIESGGAQNLLLGRRMRVNGRNILSLDYSQNYKMEKIYDDHTKFVLRIKYNNHGLPTLWMPPKGITPVNVTYDRYGHPATWERGPNHETVTYDDEGRVTSLTTAAGAVWTFLNQGDVVQMTSPGSRSRFTFSFDSFGNLLRATLPSGDTYRITRLLAAGFVRTVLETPSGEKTNIDRDSHGHVLMTSRSGEGRKVVYRYDSRGHLAAVLHDKRALTLVRDPRSGELLSLSDGDVTTRLTRNGPLIESVIVTSRAPGRGEVAARFSFRFDSNFRLKSSTATINSTSLATDVVSFDDVSGKVSSFGSFSVLYYRTNLYVVSKQDLVYTKERDYNGRPIKVELDIYRNPMFLLMVEYDAMGRISTQTVRIGPQSNVTESNYLYERNGLVSRVSERIGKEELIWKYFYNADGKLLTKQRGSAVTKITYKGGRVAACGSIAYSFDRDGFLQQRGEEWFEFDSLGHLVQAFSKHGAYRISYGYDGFGRLSSRLDQKTNQVLKFYYADISNPTRLTHYFNSSSGLVATFRYDMEGVVMAMDLSDGETLLIVCDHNRSPRAVFDGVRRIAKEIRYSPFGEVVHDSNEAFRIVLGYRGGIYDPDTRLVHFAERSTMQQSLGSQENYMYGAGYLPGVDYDPMTGQSATPDYSDLLGKRRRIVRPVRDYQIWDPVNPEPPYDQMTRVSSWLEALGFKLQNVAPDPKINERQKDKSSVECQLSHHLRTYINLQTVAPSSLVPQVRTKSTSVANGAIFAQGLVLSADRGFLSSNVAANIATNDVKRIGSVLNGGRILIGRQADTPHAHMAFTSSGKPVLYVAKPSDSLRADRAALTMTSSSRNLDGGYSATSQRTTINVRLEGNVMTLSTQSCVVKVIYTSDEDSEGSRIVENARAASEIAAWRLQKSRAEQSRAKGRWNLGQVSELRRVGKVSGFRADFFWAVEKYPEFADSARNMEFKPS